MKPRTGVLAAGAGCVLAVGLWAGPAAAACPANMVVAGTGCIDQYEASLWYVPPSEKTLIRRIQDGSVTLGHLTASAAVAAGVVQVGLTHPLDDPGDPPPDDLVEAGCPADGNGCVDVYAVSLPGVQPARRASWPQAAAAARNSLKRLPTNQEWQVAALGTPDGAPCAQGAVPVATGSIPACVSDVGAFDMVGNVAEWVADWAPRSPAGVDCPTLFGSGQNTFCGADNTDFPNTTALVRGFSGVYDVSGLRPLAARESTLGFRATR
jgi:hypothetical protein